jgi:hypothetical protein
MRNEFVLDSLDAVLSEHPFGDSKYIQQQLHICYRRRLHKISSRLPVAGQLLDTLGLADAYTQYRVIGDTVVRCAVQQAFKQIETGTPYGLPLEQCEEVFRATIHHLEDGKCGPLGCGLSDRLGPEPYHGWIWSDERPDDVFVRAFRHVVEWNYGETPLCTLDSDELAMLAKGARLLNELLPLSSSSALSHAHLIAVFPSVGAWARRGSSSQFRLSGTFFLSRTGLSSPWWVAEHLYHEALHQQLYDFRQGHSLYIPTYGEQEGPKVCSLWNLPDSDKSNYWDTDRVFAAYHVYVHLALLCALAEQRAPQLTDAYGPPDRIATSRVAFERAHYLGEQLREVCWDQLGLAGRQAVDWFSSILDVINPSPPPEGSTVHLLIDRYRKEAAEIQYLLNKDERRSDLSRQLAILAQEEARIARTVLVADNAGADLGRFDDAVAKLSEEDQKTDFARVRRLIADTILHASQDGYGWKPGPGSPDEILKRMIENSSETLVQLLAKAPSSPAQPA